MQGNDKPKTKATPTRGHQSRPDVGNSTHIEDRCDHNEGTRYLEYDADGCGYYVWVCDVCGYIEIDDMP